MASGHVERTYRPNTWQHRPNTHKRRFLLPTRSRPHVALFGPHTMSDLSPAAPKRTSANRSGFMGLRPAEKAQSAATRSLLKAERSGSNAEDQDNRLIVLWLTLKDLAMSVSTSPASRRAIASLF